MKVISVFAVLLVSACSWHMPECMDYEKPRCDPTKPWTCECPKEERNGGRDSVGLGLSDSKDPDGPDGPPGPPGGGDGCRNCGGEQPDPDKPTPEKPDNGGDKPHHGGGHGKGKGHDKHHG